MLHRDRKAFYHNSGEIATCLKLIIFSNLKVNCLISSVQLLSHVQLFATPLTTECQASLSITSSRSSPKLMSIESVMPSNHLICRPLLFLPSIFPSIRVFSNESALRSGGQSTGVSASTSVLPMNTQGWSPLGWTGWISLQSKGLSRVFSNTTVQKHQFFGAQLSSQSNSHIHTWPLGHIDSNDHSTPYVCMVTLPFPVASFNTLTLFSTFPWDKHLCI